MPGAARAAAPRSPLRRPATSRAVAAVRRTRSADGARGSTRLAPARTSAGSPGPQRSSGRHRPWRRRRARPRPPSAGAVVVHCDGQVPNGQAEQGVPAGDRDAEDDQAMQAITCWEWRVRPTRPARRGRAEPARAARLPTAHPTSTESGDHYRHRMSSAPETEVRATLRLSLFYPDFVARETRPTARSKRDPLRPGSWSVTDHSNVVGHRPQAGEQAGLVLLRLRRVVVQEQRVVDARAAPACRSPELTPGA